MSWLPSTAIPSGPDATPQADIFSETIVRTFLTIRISRFGCTSTVITDRGRQFQRTLFTALAESIGTDLPVGKWRGGVFSLATQGGHFLHRAGAFNRSSHMHFPALCQRRSALSTRQRQHHHSGNPQRSSLCPLQAADMQATRTKID